MGSRRKFYLFLFVFLMFLGIVVWAQKNFQPIQYNHKLHVEDAGLSCTDCHVNVETHERASIPNITVCADCHDDPETDNAEIKRVVSYVQEEKQIPWQTVHRVRDYAYFSHRRHVTLGQLECETCHGNVSARELPFEKPFVEINMSWCIDCHEQRAVTTDCYACHR